MPIGVLHQISALVYSLEKFHFSCLLEGLESLYYEFVVVSTVNIYHFKLIKKHNFLVVSNMGSGASQPATSAAPVTRASYPYPVQQPYPSNHPQQHQQPTTCDPYAPPTYQQYMSSDPPPRESSPPPPPSEAGSNHYPPQNTQYYQPPSQWNTAGLSKSSCPYYME